MKPLDLQNLLALLPPTAWQNLDVKPDDAVVFQAAVGIPALGVQGLVVGSMSGTPVPGQIQYVGGVFQGWNGTSWLTLSGVGSGSPDNWFDNGSYLAPTKGASYPAQMGAATVNDAVTPVLVLARTGAIPSTPGEAIGQIVSQVGGSLGGFTEWIATETWTSTAQGSTYVAYVTRTGTKTPLNLLQLSGNGFIFMPNATGLRVGDLTTPRERLDVLGAVVLGASTAGAPADGTLQYTGTKFQGRVGGVWVDIPGAGGASNYWQPGVTGAIHTLAPIDLTQDVFVGPAHGIRFAQSVAMDPTIAPSIMGSGAGLLVQPQANASVIVAPGGTNAITMDLTGVSCLHAISVGNDIQSSPRPGTMQFDATNAFRGYDGTQWLSLSAWIDSGTYLNPRQGSLYPVNHGSTTVSSATTPQLQLNAVVANPSSGRQLSYLYTLVQGGNAALEIVSAGQNWTLSTAHGTNWELQTVPNNSTSLQQRLLVTSSGFSNFPNTTGVRIGDATAARERLEVLGAIIVGLHTNATPVAGTIQFTGTVFQGYDGANWGTFASGLWQPTITGFVGRGRAVESAIEPIAPGTSLRLDTGSGIYFGQVSDITPCIDTDSPDDLRIAAGTAGAISLGLGTATIAEVVPNGFAVSGVVAGSLGLQAGGYTGPAPTAGLIQYTAAKGFEGYDGTAWHPLGGGGTSLWTDNPATGQLTPIPPSRTLNLAGNILFPNNVAGPSGPSSVLWDSGAGDWSSPVAVWGTYGTLSLDAPQSIRFDVAGQRLGYFDAAGFISESSIVLNVDLRTTHLAGSLQWMGGHFQGYTGSAWVNLDVQGGPPSGPAGGDLAGTYPNPTIKAGLIPVLPTTLPPNGPAGGDLTGAYPNPTVRAGLIPATLPPSGAAGGALAGTYPNPTLAAGVLPTTLPPSGAATGDLTGTYPAPTIGAGKVTLAKLAPSSTYRAYIAQAFAYAVGANISSTTLVSILRTASWTPSGGLVMLNATIAGIFYPVSTTRQWWTISVYRNPGAVLIKQLLGLGEIAAGSFTVGYPVNTTLVITDQPPATAGTYYDIQLAVGTTSNIFRTADWGGLTVSAIEFA